MCVAAEQQSSFLCDIRAVWSLRAQGHSTHKGGWVDFGDNLACYSQYPYSPWDRMCRKPFCLLCVGLILKKTSCFPKEISMYPARYIRIRRPELKNEMQSSPLTVYTQLWVYLLDDNRSEPCPFFCYWWKTLLVQTICLRIISWDQKVTRTLQLIQNEFRFFFFGQKAQWNSL